MSRYIVVILKQYGMIDMIDVKVGDAVKILYDRPRHSYLSKGDVVIVTQRGVNGVLLVTATTGETWFVHDEDVVLCDGRSKTMWDD